MQGFSEGLYLGMSFVHASQSSRERREFSEHRDVTRIQNTNPTEAREQGEPCTDRRALAGQGWASAPAPWESQQQTPSFFLSLTWACNRALENLMWSRKMRLDDEHSPLAHAGCCWSWKTLSQRKLEGRESAHLHGSLLPPLLLPKTELSHCPGASTSPGSCWMMESQESCAGYNHLEQLSSLGNKHRHKKSSRVLLHLCAWVSRITRKFCSSVCSKVINRLGVF